jgi:hypothetical protein
MQPAIEALGMTVIANGREWRLNARTPNVVEAETVFLRLFNE